MMYVKFELFSNHAGPSLGYPGAQDCGIMTNGLKKVCKLTDNDKCRFCHTEVESPNHLMSGCKILMADGHYTKRHNKVCKYLHWTILNSKNIPTQKVWLHEPEPVTANDEVTVYYDKIIPTGRFIESGAVKPDIVVWDRKERSAIIIDVSVPSDFGINRAELEKVTKYQDLKNALRESWDLKEIDAIPVIVGATCVMKDNIQAYLDRIPGEPQRHKCQTAAIRGTLSLLKRALGSIKYHKDVCPGAGAHFVLLKSFKRKKKNQCTDRFQDKLLQLVKSHHQSDLLVYKSVIDLAIIFKKENNILSADPEKKQSEPARK